MIVKGILHQCPCCGQALPNMPDALIDAASGAIIHNGTAAILPLTEFNVFQTLWDASPRIVSKEKLFSELYWDRADGEEAEPKIIDVLVCKIRPSLTSLGIEIITHWGRGYSLRVAAIKREAA